MSERHIDSYTPITDSDKGKNPITVEENDYFLQLAINASLTDKGKNPISIEGDHEETDFFLQLAIKASLRTSNCYYVDIYDSDDDDLVAFSVQHPKNDNPFSCNEPGNSSNSKSNQDPIFVCEICVESKNPNDSFKIKGCSHVYCTDCMIKYVASKLEDNFTLINCPVPNCKGSLEPEDCRDLLPKEIFERWGDALCQGTILGHERFYCPFKDCSMVLILDGEKQDVKESECPYCHRLFCVQCKVPWHPEIECGEFQKLHKDEREREDILLMKLIQSNKWTRCPTCRFIVEKTHGCRYIRCRCGTAFCYNCTSTRVDELHYCHNCRA